MYLECTRCPSTAHSRKSAASSVQPEVPVSRSMAHMPQRRGNSAHCLHSSSGISCAWRLNEWGLNWIHGARRQTLFRGCVRLESFGSRNTVDVAPIGSPTTCRATRVERLHTHDSAALLAGFSCQPHPQVYSCTALVLQSWQATVNLWAAEHTSLLSLLLFRKPLLNEHTLRSQGFVSAITVRKGFRSMTAATLSSLSNALPANTFSFAPLCQNMPSAFNMTCDLGQTSLSRHRGRQQPFQNGEDGYGQQGPCLHCSRQKAQDSSAAAE